MSLSFFYVEMMKNTNLMVIPEINSRDMFLNTGF